MRARPRHAHGADGRHRPRRAARPPDQGPGDPRVDPRRRHDRPRQDRHGHDGPDEPRRRDRDRRHHARRRRCGSRARWRTLSEHPVARAIAKAPAPPATGGPTRRALAGLFAQRRGPRGRGHRRRARASSSAGPRCSRERGIDLPPELADARAAAEQRGQTAVAAAWDGEARALFVVADTRQALLGRGGRALKRLGLRPVLLTGDNETTARAVAAEVGIDEVIAEVCRPTRQPSSGGSRTRAAPSPWSATA